jgi:hypothetical protein
MSQETLKNLRFVVSGIILVAALLPLFATDLTFAWLKTELVSLQGLLYVVVIFPAGWLYYLSNLRKAFIRESLQQIHANINDQMLAPCLSDPLINGAQKQLREGRELLNIFYRFVDSDNSLKTRAGNVRFNGLMWTSVADSQAIATIFVLAYPIRFALGRHVCYLWLGLFCGLWFLVCEHLWMPIVTKRHIQLSNEQLDFIQQHFQKELCSKLTEAVEHLSDTAP